MADYTIRTTVHQPYDAAVAAVREQLGEAGFGVLTEIDLRAALKEKLGVDVAPQVILGACRPQLAHEALEADPAVAALLPCNVVVREVEEGRCVVEALDPETIVSLAGDHDVLRRVADDARGRLLAALDRVGTEA